VKYKFNTFQGFIVINQRIMQLAMRGLLRFDFLRKVSMSFLDFSGCDAVEMWLKERGRYYRDIVSRAGKPGSLFEIMPTEEVNGRIIPRVTSDSLGERICRDMILGRTDSFSECLTAKGSFWSEDTGRLGSVEPFKSLVVIPISVEHETIALLQLKAKAAEVFRKEDVEFYESMEQTLGMALIHRRTQVELRERIKELTCLYGIAKLVEDRDLTISDILQGIVLLLPPAWLYPEVASARIILDETTYKTDPFQESAFKLASQIIIHGEQRGIVEVHYSEEKPELDEGPFLREERSLIDTIAREIALIVERKQTGDEKAKLQEQLRHADRLATIGQLSAGVAHELNEPIGSILGFAQLIQKCPDLPEQAAQDAEKITKGSLHAREVIKKMMLFARQMPPQKTAVDLNQIVDEGLYFLESRCAKEGIEVERTLARHLPEIHADPSQMTQVLVNIVVNAIQAMPGGGTLGIQTKASPKNIQLIIQDSGVGMEGRIKEQVFLPFFTTKDIGEGTGLGLAVVHGIVTSHGGTIDVESEVGKGTTFKVKLPIAGL
jgi:two-component system NtrC family sensor kinase